MNLVAPLVFQESTSRFVEPRLMLLLALCASVILPPEMFSAVATVMLLWCIPLSPMRATGLALKFAAPFVVLGVLGTIMSGGNDSAAVWRDIWYVGKLAVFLALGLILGLRQVNPEGIHRVLVVFAVISGLYSFAVLLGQTYFATELMKNREVGVSLAALGAIPLLVDRIIARPGPPRWANVSFLLIILGAAVVSDSRMTLIGIAIMLVAWKGEFSTLRRTIVAMIALGLLVAILWQFLPEYHGGDLNALTKLRRSFEEMSFTDSYNRQEMYFNWRGFEAYNAQLMFEATDAWHKIFGSGLGAQVDLGLSVRMSRDMDYQFLPTIHNGFYYILIKFGIVGLVVYLLSVLGWLRWGRRNFDASNLEDRILRGLVVTTLASTTVITGLYNKEALNSVATLIAFLVGFGFRRHHDLLYRLGRQRAAARVSGRSPQLSTT